MARPFDPRDIGLKSDSFTTDIDTTVTPRILANIRAWQKVGKTDFSIRDAPDPIIVYNFDNGLEGVIEQFLKDGRKIIVAGIPVKGRKYPTYNFAKPLRQTGEGPKATAYLDRIKKASGPVWDRWIHDMREGYESEARTMVIDTGGAAFALGKFAFHGMAAAKPGTDDPYGTKSGELNAIFQGIVQDGYSYDKNVLWLHRVKEKWDSGGLLEEIGYKQLPFEVQVNIELSKGKKGRVATIIDSRFRNGKLNGMEFFDSDGEYSFAHIASMLTKTDIETWR